MNEVNVNTKKSKGTKKAETAEKVRRITDQIVNKIDAQLATQNWIDEVKASNRNRRANFKKNRQAKNK